MSTALALAELRRHAGTKFDPLVVEAFAEAWANNWHSRARPEFYAPGAARRAATSHASSTLAAPGSSLA